MQRILIQLLSTIAAVVLVVSAVTALALAGTIGVTSGQWRVPGSVDLREFVGDVLAPHAPQPSRIVYLHRAQVSVRGGSDDAVAGESSLIAPGAVHSVPRYKTSNVAWRRLLRCVQDKFAGYDVSITDERPRDGDYVLVKVGGKPADVGMAGLKLGGVAPFNGRAIPNSIVFVFDQRGRFRTKNNCETAAHEVGHVYGLDHTYRCGDLMSYRQGCGKKKFVDAAMPCGEHAPRDCGGSSDAQNSARRLLTLLGRRQD